MILQMKQKTKFWKIERAPLTAKDNNVCHENNVRHWTMLKLFIAITGYKAFLISNNIPNTAYVQYSRYRFDWIPFQQIVFSESDMNLRD